jgi:hypothetical protein
VLPVARIWKEVPRQIDVSGVRMLAVGASSIFRNKVSTTPQLNGEERYISRVLIPLGGVDKAGMVIVTKVSPGLIIALSGPLKSTPSTAEPPYEK